MVAVVATAWMIFLVNFLVEEEVVAKNPVQKK
jgi:hypothetical protein